MTPEERAEKIMEYICPDTNLPQKDKEFIAAQIQEAVEEARNSVLNEQKCKDCGCSYERCCCNPVREAEAYERARVDLNAIHSESDATALRAENAKLKETAINACDENKVLESTNARLRDSLQKEEALAIELIKRCDRLREALEKIAQHRTRKESRASDYAEYFPSEVALIAKEALSLGSTKAEKE